MDKNQFNSVLKRFTSTSKREAEEILSLKSQYPYSQLLTALAARVCKDHNFTIQHAELTNAAVYAADRAVLKEVITYEPVEEIIAPREEEKVEAASTPPVETPAGNDDETAEVKTETPLLKNQQAELAEPKIELEGSSKAAPPIVQITRPAEKIIRYELDSDDVAGEVMKDLKKLSQLKHDFEMLLTDYAETSHKSEKVSTKKTATPVSKVDMSDEEAVKEPKKTERKESLRVRRERMIAHAKALQSQSSESKEKEGKTRNSSDPQDELIDNIKKANAEIKPESEKQKEQISIINHFIKKQPSISNPKQHAPQTSGDLSQIKTGEFGDNIISETLVEILLKQGKKDKAIEVLKKLIWKYPQKKAYFASQIEELKK